MRIAVTSDGTSPEAPVDARFGRAAGFIVFDTDTGAYEAVDNTTNLGAVQGAGIQAGEAVARLGVECLITGHCGPKAFRFLRAAGIRVCTGAHGTVREAIEAFQGGDLSPNDHADVDSHWA